MKKINTFLSIVLLGTTLVGCSKGETVKIENNRETKAPKVEIIVSAAASLKDSMEEIEEVYESKNNVILTFNFGSTGSLQKQIEEGAPADIFISAGQKQFTALEDKDLIEKGSKKDIVENELALIVNNEYKDKVTSMDDLDNLEGYIAIGETKSVPAGQYAQESLTYYNKWDLIKDKIVFAKDVTQVVSYVESGEAVCGVVYKSDAMSMENSSIVTTFDTASHKKIIYPGGVIKTSKVKDEASRFLEFLNSREGKELFTKYGFKVS